MGMGTVLRGAILSPGRVKGIEPVPVPGHMARICGSSIRGMDEKGMFIEERSLSGMIALKVPE